ncbi:MAG: manganese efflux pump MntP family protein [Planctomycetota bacterium]|nr:manganese efflux pump MntP family protein [Planctomycetota bacterium]MCX8039365.1 manganese efflux pump MntP family protein [Planctomycetota bacterium]MDW8373345.1 manganese efflux pump MntP family protein [Planctomycetota bacterium]
MLTAVLLALGLAMDAVAVSVCAALCAPQAPWPRRLRMPLAFGIFQAVMPCGGWLGGEALAEAVADWDHWVAWALLTAIGGKMLWEARRAHAECPPGDPFAWRRVLPLAVATSVDALAAGLTIAVLEVPPLFAIALVGAVTALCCAVAMALASSIGNAGAQAAAACGGLVLLAIGFKILFEHL